MAFYDNLRLIFATSPFVGALDDKFCGINA